MKRGQVSIYVIIGLVIIISTIFFFVAKNTLTEGNIAPSLSGIVEELPSEFASISPFVVKCLESTSISALKLLGESGGYIYTSELNPPSDSITFAPGSNLKIPYWHYLKSPDNCQGDCQFSSVKPSTLTMQNHISQYVRENILECLNNFNSLKELGYDAEIKEGPVVDTIISSSDVRIKLTYPLTFTRNDNRFEINEFYLSLPVNLVKIIEFGDYITNLEKEFHFLERSTLNLIVAFSDKDTTLLPPMSDSGVEIVSSVSWSKTKVKNDLKSLITTYTSLLRMVDTPSWDEIITDSYYQDNFYNRGMSIPNNSSITDLEIYFDYLSFWDIYFDLNCDGDSCEPQSFFTDLLPIGIQRYNFAYDLSYPVLVTIYDQRALYGEGYTFKFVLESNIRDNSALTSLYNPITPIGTETGTMLCDLNKKTSGDIVFKVRDAISLEPIDDALLIYTCIESCNIGKTVLGEFTSGLPVCIGGNLEIRRDGYTSSVLSLNSFIDKTDSITIDLFPKKEMDVKVIKRVLAKDGDNWIYSHDENLQEYETAIITISNNEIGIVELKGDTIDTTEVSVGDYTFEINIISDREYTVPEKDIEGIEIPAYTTDTLIVANAEIPYAFTPEDLDGNIITIYVTSYDLYSVLLEDRDLADIDVVSKEENYNLIDVQ